MPLRPSTPEERILTLKVCDPACGSGHFLIAAAHRMAKRLASVRTGDEEPSPEAVRTALRDVIGRCLYGVDINPMAVELCKVALWMEALEPGKPLSFLDHHIQCGNSLLGATPELLAQGIPEGAFEPIEGDDRAVCAEFKKRNRDERKGQGSLFDPNLQPWEQLGNLPEAMISILQTPDDTLQGVQERERRWSELVRSAPYENCRLLADAWCAAFVWKKSRAGGRYPLTFMHLQRILRNPYSLEPWMREEIRRLAAQYRFFHWHLAFPDVFRGSGQRAIGAERHRGEGIEGLTSPVPHAPALLSSGFDVVLGNPPWERVKLQEKEWFAVRRPDIASASNAAQRKRLIEQLKEEDPALYEAFLEDRRQSEGESQLLRRSGRYPLCGRGDVNTYAVFAELFRSLLAPTGRAGIIVPTGIATDDTTKAFFADLIETGSLASLYDFENRRGLFPAVDSRMKFSLLTLRAPAPMRLHAPAPSIPCSPAELLFFAHSVDDLHNPERRFTLTAEEIALLNPNTRTCPVFRSRRDAEITKGIYRRVPVLINEAEHVNPWGVSFMAMLHMANDSGLFKREPAPGLLPLYEAKMLHHFNHRWATYAGSGQWAEEAGDTAPCSPLPTPPAGDPEVRDMTLAERQNPRFVVTPRYWVEAEEVEKRLTKRDRQGNITWEWRRGWLLGWRDITNTTNERTVVASLLPRVGVGHKMPLMFPASDSPLAAACLLACLSSFALDYAARQKVGGTSMTYFYLKQLPVLPPERYGEWVAFLAPRVLELVYTAYDMAPLAQDMLAPTTPDSPLPAPFPWDEDRRFLLRCELDALYFHLYGITREEAEYILETFPLMKRKDEEAHGEYRTKRMILEIFDAMASGAYVSPLDPPPANGWTPTEEQIQAAFPPQSEKPASAAEPSKRAAPAEPEELSLVSPPSAPEPLRDRDGEIVRVRVYSETGEMLVKRGVAVGRKKSGDCTIWSVLGEGETTPRQFQSPPAVLKRLKPRAQETP